MSDSISIQLNRREFMVTSGLIAGALAIPAAAWTTSSSANPQTGIEFAAASPVCCEHEYVAGVMRPRAWTRTGGDRLEIVGEPNGPAMMRLVRTSGGEETFALSDLAFGRPQELIRSRFGDDVLRQLIAEVERRQSPAETDSPPQPKIRG